METMRAHVFRRIGQTGIEHLPIPKPKAGEALVRVTLTTIFGERRDGVLKVAVKP